MAKRLPLPRFVVQSCWGGYAWVVIDRQNPNHSIGLYTSKDEAVTVASKRNADTYGLSQ